MGFDDVPPRAPPVQPPETAEAKRQRIERQEESRRHLEELRLETSHGNQRAGFMVGLLDMQQSMREAADAEMVKILKRGLSYAKK